MEFAAENAYEKGLGIDFLESSGFFIFTTV